MIRLQWQRRGDLNQHSAKRKALKPVQIPASTLPEKRATDGARTRDPDLGKVVLYQLSHCRIFCVPLVFLTGTIDTILQAFINVNNFFYFFHFLFLCSCPVFVYLRQHAAQGLNIFRTQSSTFNIGRYQCRNIPAKIVFHKR